MAMLKVVGFYHGAVYNITRNSESLNHLELF